MSLLDALNPQQREAAEAVEGPVLIFAGAGSGKTRALTYRMAYMVQECGISPHHLLAVTFTNKAAGEMKGRIQELIGAQARGLWAGTFHSTCARILRTDGSAAGIPDNFVIYDEGDQLSLVKQALSILDRDPKQYSPSDIRNRISGAKNELVGVQEYRRTRQGHFDEVAQQVYRVYQEKLRENNALDFDDLLMRAVQLFRDSPQTLEKYQERFQYVLVDEYQDINFAQYEFVRLLAQGHRNLCVVGDDDQSIYGWRGANVGIILAFEHDWPEARVIKLEQNYRSTQKILECAYEVIRHNQGRADKKLWTRNRPGDNPVQYDAVSAEEEAEWVADTIRVQVAAQRARYGDYAILYRTNAMSRLFEEEFMRRRLPYEIVGGIRFYERAVIKDLIAYLRAVYNSQDGVSLRRIINVPARGIGDKTLGALERAAYARGCSLFEALAEAAEDEELTRRARNAMHDFRELMEKLREKAKALPLVEFCRAVAEDSGYLRALEESSSAEDATKAENIKEFVSLAQRFAQREEDPSLANFLQHLALISDLDEAEAFDSRISLITLHSAKGLEFPIVFMVGMEEGLFPHQRSLGDERQLEEERRLCYVGMTRAQHMLHLTHAHRRTIYGQPQQQRASRFLGDLPAELVDRQGSLAGVLSKPAAAEEEEEGAVVERRAGGPQIDLPRILSRARENGDLARQRAEEPTQSPATPAGRREARRNDRARASAATGAAPAAPEYKSGDRVRHAKFGAGVVVQVKGEGERLELVVAFPKQGVKTLAAAYARLERL